MATTAALFQIFESLSCWRQEDKNLYSIARTLRQALPAFKTCSGQMESGPGAFLGFSCWRARASSSEENSPEMHLSSRVGIGDHVDSLLVAIPENRVANSSKCRQHGNAPGMIKA